MMQVPADSICNIYIVDCVRDILLIPQYDGPHICRIVVYRLQTVNITDFYQRAMHIIKFEDGVSRESNQQFISLV